MNRLNQLIKKPSFFFVAYQGVMFLLTVIVGFFISGIYQNWNPQEYLIEFFILALLLTSFLTLYTFITYFTFKKKRNTLFNFFFLLIHILIYGYIYACFFINDIAKYEESILYMFVAIPSNIIAFILFTLIPYLILLFVERRRNLTIETPPYGKNKLYLYTTIFSILAYICANLFCIGFLIFAFFKALS